MAVITGSRPEVTRPIMNPNELSDKDDHIQIDDEPEAKVSNQAKSLLQLICENDVFLLKEGESINPKDCDSCPWTSNWSMNLMFRYDSIRDEYDLVHIEAEETDDEENY